MFWYCAHICSSGVVGPPALGGGGGCSGTLPHQESFRSAQISSFVWKQFDRHITCMHVAENNRMSHNCMFVFVHRSSEFFRKNGQKITKKLAKSKAMRRNDWFWIV